MTENKVYVDELPENCKKCVYSQINLAFGVETRICNLQYGFISANNDNFPNCPLQSLKTHDRELVKEMCDKIARNVRVGKIQGKWYAVENDLRAILDQIQKEYEK